MRDISEQQLLDCLDLMEDGMSLADVLTRYPEQADALRPFLETAAQVSQLATNPTIAQQNKSQAAFLSQAAAMKAAPVESATIWLWFRRLLLPAVALSLFVILFGASLFTVSASALPGEANGGGKPGVAG